jgi:hypothetical protein
MGRPADEEARDREGIVLMRDSEGVSLTMNAVALAIDCALSGELASGVGIFHWASSSNALSAKAGASSLVAEYEHS